LLTTALLRYHIEKFTGVFMDKSTLMLIFAIGAGLFSIAGAVFNWDWFMNNSRARLFVNIFGRDGARVFYVILGIIIIALGFFSASIS
jgi:hypothetical protein